MITYYLALALLAVPDAAPEIIEGYRSNVTHSAREQCETEADKQNRNNPLLRDPKVRELGGEFVCLRMERLYV